jgi:hypothetical protein
MSLSFYSQVFPCFSQAPNSPFNISAGANAISSAIGDFNLDSKIDVALANSSLGSVSIYNGNNDGTFTLAGTYTVNGNPENITAANLNNDSYLDLIVANSTNNNITILYGDNLGNFIPGVTFSNILGGPTGVITGDFDSNGKLDIITSNYGSDSVTVYDGYPSGNFDSTKVIFKADTNMTGITTSDFNNDGKLDIAVCSNTNNRVAVLIGNGNGTFNAPVYYTVGNDPQSIITLDFNNDGELDLATANYVGSVSVIFGNGSGIFSAARNFAAQAGAAVIKAIDLNNDGRIDIITGNMSSNSVTLLLGNGNGNIISSRNYAVGSSPANVNLGDFNNDGKNDFIAVNRNSNNIHVFLKNPTSQTISGSLTSSGGNPINGKVVIYKYYPASTSSKLDSLDLMNINSNSYSFAVADSGSYILKAVPSASSLQTTYAQSSTGWKNATVITHGCLVNTVQNFSVQAFANIGTGSGSMSGVLTQTLGFGQKPNNTMAPYAPSDPGNPIGGIIVKGGKNPGGNYFAQTETDASGTYTLSNLPNTLPGEKLFIFIDMPGLDTTGTYYKTFTSGESYTGLNFLVDSAKIRPAVTTSTTPTPTLDVSVIESQVENSISIYPNPTNESINLSFELKNNSSVKIELIDLVGKKLYILETEKQFNAQKHQISYPLKEISDGAYFIKIQINNTIINRKILITKH